MPRSVAGPTITGAILKGIKQAQRDYSTWSGGYWLWQAPEYFLVTYIAQQISKDIGLRRTGSGHAKYLIIKS